MTKPFFSTIIKASELKEVLQSNYPVEILDSSFKYYFKTNEYKLKHLENRIPGSKFFDFEMLADKSNSFLHMTPTKEVFIDYMKALNIKKDDTLTVIYDRIQAKSAPKLWFMLKMFGKSNVAVLDGGLEKWEAEGYPTEKGIPQEPRKDQEESGYDYIKDGSRVKDIVYVGAMSQLCSHNPPQTLARIIDARSPSRHLGIVSEPEGVKSGRIPGCKNLFYMYCLNPDFTYKSKQELLELFYNYKLDLSEDGNVIHYSGIGTSACSNILALEIAGEYKNFLYEGSWAEWSSKNTHSDSPVSVKSLIENEYAKHIKKKELNNKKI